MIDNNYSKNQSYISVIEYRNHHTDIETKLIDLKNLFLKHIKIKNELTIKRKFLNTLFGLEFDLKIHSIIEEKILIPLIEHIEKKNLDKIRKNIVIIAPSNIVYEGLSVSIMKAEHDYNIFRVDDLEEISELQIKHETSVIFINPLKIYT